MTRKGSGGLISDGHRMAGAGRDPWGSPRTASPLEQSPQSAVPSVQAAFQYLPARELHHVSGQTVPVSQMMSGKHVRQIRWWRVFAQDRKLYCFEQSNTQQASTPGEPYPLLAILFLLVFFLCPEHKQRYQGLRTKSTSSCLHSHIFVGRADQKEKARRSS